MKLGTEMFIIKGFNSRVCGKELEEIVLGEGESVGSVGGGSRPQVEPRRWWGENERLGKGERNRRPIKFGVNTLLTQVISYY